MSIEQERISVKSKMIQDLQLNNAGSRAVLAQFWIEQCGMKNPAVVRDGFDSPPHHTKIYCELLVHDQTNYWFPRIKQRRNHHSDREYIYHLREFGSIF